MKQTAFGFDKYTTGADDLIQQKLHQSPELQKQVANLPDQEIIPDEIYNQCKTEGNYDAVTIYMTRKYGGFINGYSPRKQNAPSS